MVLGVAALAAHGQEEAPADPARAAYEKALDLLRRKQWKPAQRAFRRLMKDFPDSPLVADAEARGGENAYLGTTPLWIGGPSDRRIDVAVMGDGFTIAPGDQNLEEKWAKLCIDVLFNEEAFAEYKNYFNVHFVRLASLEEGVDPGLSPEEAERARKRNIQRHRDADYKVDYSTALDCKAAGPQGQVVADRSLVYRWLEIADRDAPGCGDNRFVIAFARFGQLGMGGGGIANVGRPDKSITVHEFGHAFSRLLDEYANNPGEPEGRWADTLHAANAFPSRAEPKADKVPWAHWLAKRARGVGIYEGGATFQKGVWRPARSCAMNVGDTQLCPVCREQTVLVIYEYVSPIDVAEPATEALVEAKEGDDTRLFITPMRPRRRELDVAWYVAARAADTLSGAETKPDPAPDVRYPEDDFAGLQEMPYPESGVGEGGLGLENSPYQGARAARNRDAYATPPPGKKSNLGKVERGRKDERRHYFPVGELAPGRYTVTAEVRDETDLVVKDDRHLLVERAVWSVDIGPPD
jgi:hypothetical protein